MLRVITAIYIPDQLGMRVEIEAGQGTAVQSNTALICGIVCQRSLTFNDDVHFTEIAAVEPAFHGIGCRSPFNVRVTPAAGETLKLDRRI
jgi:hypothetical protein